MQTRPSFIDNASEALCSLPHFVKLLGRAEAFAVVAILGDFVGPGAVFQIPVHGLGEASSKGFEGFPAELGLEFGAVDRIAAVVAGAVGDIGDLGVVGSSIGAGGFRIEEGAEGVYHIEVRALIEAADIVSLADAPAL